MYSGHQFGVWAGQLGDGRALLLGEIDSPAGPLEIQLKGSGLTPYSRMGDGRAVLRSSIREFLCSEAMHALGIPTTRALAVIGSPQPVLRETVETAAVVTRVAPCFLRFGHFEHFAHTAAGRRGAAQLVDAVIERYFPECRDAPQPLLRLARRGRAPHRAPDGAVAGGGLLPWRDEHRQHVDARPDDRLRTVRLPRRVRPAHICNHSDQQGRYAYARQPGIAWWNLHALAQALLPLLDAPPKQASERAAAALEPYKTEFARRDAARLRAKLGLRDRARRRHGADRRPAAPDGRRTAPTTRITLRRLGEFSPRRRRNAPCATCSSTATTFDAWAARYAQRLRAENSVDAERRRA